MRSTWLNALAALNVPAGAPVPFGDGGTTAHRLSSVRQASAASAMRPATVRVGEVRSTSTSCPVGTRAGASVRLRAVRAVVAADAGERRVREDHLHGDLEVAGDAQGQVQARAELAAFQV